MLVDVRVAKPLDLKAIKLPESATTFRDTMRANFILFPSYCRRVYGLMDHFAATRSDDFIFFRENHGSMRPTSLQ